MRCPKEIRKGQRCTVPLNAEGKHTDGNPEHYNGNSHWSKDGGFVRG